MKDVYFLKRKKKINDALWIGKEKGEERKRFKTITDESSVKKEAVAEEVEALKSKSSYCPCK